MSLLRSAGGDEAHAVDRYQHEFASYEALSAISAERIDQLGGRPDLNPDGAPADSREVAWRTFN